MNKRHISGMGLGLLLAVSACAQTREIEQAVDPTIVHAALEGKPEALHPHLAVALQQGPRNRVLNDMRLGLALFSLGQDESAAEFFDNALTSIESVYADNPEAEKARGLFVREVNKDFKGEPYERAMAYYYRGLLYMRAGDYENAHASFTSGVLQDTLAEQEHYQADFGLLILLEGWANHCYDKTAESNDLYADFQKHNADFPLPAEAHNTLILVETGWSPVKAHGKGKEAEERHALRFFPGGEAEIPRLSLPSEDGKTLDVTASAIEDVFFQASTRGGRTFDVILKGKAQFKEASGAIGDALLTAGVVTGTVAYTHDNQNAGYAALGMLMAGLVAKGVEAAVQDEADIRYWDNLPGTVFGHTAFLPKSVESVDVTFLNADGTANGRTQTVPVVTAGTCRLVWARSNPAVPFAPRAPFSAPEQVMSQPVAIPARK